METSFKSYFTRHDSVCRVIKWGIAFIVTCVTFLTYLPALQNGFVNWDDDLYVYENQGIQSLDFSFFIWSFTADVGSLWHPATLFSLALDYAVWGTKPFGYHLTNILFHAFNTGLVFILVNKLVESQGLGREIRSNKRALVTGFVTSFLFGIHPLHVESVAWISERKDVLSAFFFLLTLLAYLKYTTLTYPKRTIHYILCLTLFALALMSKSMVVTLPIIFLLLDIYPLKRLSVTGRSLKSVFIEKAPFFGLSILSAAITIWVHHSAGGLKTFETASLIMRILTAIRSYIFYLVKIVFPFNLAPLYPYPVKIDFLSLEYLGYFILFTAILYFTWLLRENKVFWAVLFYYAITLLPVIGLIQVGDQASADRYTYLPSLSPFLLIGLGIGYLFERYSEKRYVILIVITSLFLLSGMLINRTLTQITIWQDSITLWSHEIRIFPNAIDKAYFNLGAAYNGIGDYSKSINSYDIGIKLNRYDAKAHLNRGFAHDKLNNYQLAIQDYSKAIDLDPLYVDAFNNRGIIYNTLGENQLAIADLNRAIEINPQYAMAYYNLGLVYSQLENHELSRMYYEKAAGIEPRLLK